MTRAGHGIAVLPGATGARLGFGAFPPNAKSTSMLRRGTANITLPTSPQPADGSGEGAGIPVATIDPVLLRLFVASNSGCDIAIFAAGASIGNAVLGVDPYELAAYQVRR